MISFDRPLYDGASAELSGGLFLLWDRGPGAPSLQDALLKNIIRDKLESLPEYGVFDCLRFSLSNSTILLTGVAANRELPPAALQMLSDLPLIEKVINLVELLPESIEDDMIRAEAYARLYADPLLATYRGVSSAGSHAIRIVAKHGALSLVGQVASRADAERARRLAQTVYGVVSVQCLLTVTGNWN